MRVGAADRGAPGLHGLAQRFQRGARKLGPFVEEQHAEMRQADLARLRAMPAAHQRRDAGRMMRVAEGRAADQLAAREHPRHRMHEADFQRLRRGQVGQQAGQARGEHRFAGAGRADHQQVQRAGRRDFQRALGAFLAAHLRQIRAAPGLGLGGGQGGGGQQLAAGEMVDQGGQVGGGQDLHRAGPGGFGALGARADQAKLPRPGADRGRQHARHRRQRAIQRQFAKRREFRDGVARDDLHRSEHAERDGQVEMAAFLQQVGGGEVHDHPLRRQGQADGGQRRADAFLALGHRLVRQADDEEGGQPLGQLHLDLDGDGLDAGEGEGRDAGDGTHKTQG